MGNEYFDFDCLIGIYGDLDGLQGSGWFPHVFLRDRVCLIETPVKCARLGNQLSLNSMETQPKDNEPY